MTDTSGVSSQVISLPQGGGAIQGIGESFSPDLFTGTGNFAVPLALPAGRGGFQPELSLAYSTGNGNGPFGLGWDLSVPGIARKTSKGLPRYDDGQDTFVLSGQEDLVAVEGSAAATRYRPRTEGLFARIVHHHDAANDFWDVHSKSGLVSRYGAAQAAGRDPAVVADPDDRSQVFAWKLTQTEDPFGNQIVYRYGRDLAHGGLRHFDQLYLEEIGYVDYLDASQNPRFLVTVAFDYEDASEAGAGRPDPFSHHRAGFEIRTRRRCQRIEVRTHADEAASPEAQGTLARRYELVYLDQRVAAGELSADLLPPNGVSLLSQVRVTGHDVSREAEADRVEAMPPLEFGYTAFEPTRQEFFPVGGELPAVSLASPDLELADLSGNGLPDIVQLNGVARYWLNAGDGTFRPPRTMQLAPAGASLADPNVRLLDADGDGRIDLLVNRPGQSGYFPLSRDGEWDAGSFRAHRQAPSFPLADPDVALVDLDGDGVTDAVRAGARFEYFVQEPEQGWRELRRVPRRSLEEFPNVDFADPRVQWADMTGDGLQDVVLIHHRSVEYWPSQGYGDWGPRVRMRPSPELPAGYDPRRVLLGDVDGDGCADLVYVDDRRVLVWINQSGNGWSRPVEIAATPRVTTPEAVQLVDLLGNGIRGLMWTADANGLGRDQAFFLDFTGAVKPYLLDAMDNHMGAVTRVEYAPSTRFYLDDADRREGRWQTPLPFPVQVVARVEAIDEISQGKLTTEYTYHHGYWDGAEREFRGFGRVDQRDTESFERFNKSGLHTEPTVFTRVENTRFSPPTLTKTWFHLGPIGAVVGERSEADFSGEYWPEDPSKLERPSDLEQLLAALSHQDRADALRSLRGSTLRTELYALDGSVRADRPYTVSETLQGLREETPPPDPSSNRQRIFFPHMLAQRTTRWERGNDPMTQFSFTDDYDECGHPRKQTSVACPRGWRALADMPGQPYLATRVRTAYATAADPERYIKDRVTKVDTYEIRNDGTQLVFELKDLPDGSPELELIGQELNFYDGEAFQGRPFGEVGSHGALVRSESLVLTEEILRQAHKSGDAVLDPPEVPPYLVADGSSTSSAEYPQEFLDLLAPLGGHTFHAGDEQRARGYFVATARHQYDFHTPTSTARGLLHAIKDPFGRNTEIAYDAFDLLPTAVTDPVGLVTQARYDHRVLQPREVTDPNGNRAGFAFTPLGLLESTAVMGKAGEPVGDTVEVPGTRFEYDLRAFERSPAGARQPVSVRSTQRVHHVDDPDVPLPEREDTIETVEYSDGFGRLLQTRTQAEDVMFGDPTFGEQVLSADQTDPPTDAVGRRRQDGQPLNVVVSGWQIYDNKGRAAEAFEPFFDQGFAYAAPQDTQFGQKTTTFYDPRGDVIRTVNPDGSEQRVVLGVPGTISAPDLSDPDAFEPTPWETYTYDANDNSGRTHGSGDPSHFDTPASIEVDALGRVVSAVERNGPVPATDWFTTRSTYDIRGNVLAVTDALGRAAFRYLYDLADQPLRVENIDAGLRRVVLDAVGGEIERRDSKGALILQGFDPLQRPVRLWARDDAESPVTLRERLTYGDGGDPGQDPVERTENRDANRLGVLHQHYDEAGQLTFASYDFKGNVAEKVRRVVADEALLDTPTGEFRIDWVPLQGTDLGTHAASLLDPFEYRTSATHDALGRSKVIRCPEDVEGRRQELRPRYNRAGALERVELDGEAFVDHIAYNAKGQRTLIALGNGVMTRHAYDPQTFRMVRLRSEHYAKPNPETPTYERLGAALQDFAYDYDLAGNITTIRDRTPRSGIPDSLLGADALDRGFSFDPLYRLLSATGRECDVPPVRPPWEDGPRCTDPTRVRPYTQHYRCDPVGNMEQLRHVANGGSFTRRLSHVPGNNRLDSVSIGNSNPTVFGYHHDANGNLIQENSERHFEWDHTDRMKAFRTQPDGSPPSVHARYLYDSAGQRVKKLVEKQAGGVETTVYIDDLFEHHRWQLDGANNRLHVMDDQQRIALVRVGPAHPDDRGPAVQNHLGDHLGSSNLMLDDAGGFINREEYQPYGETSFGSFGRKRYRFTGKERDEESGLCYHDARYYAPWLLCWVSTDPIGFSPTGNLYTYSACNPLRYTDMSGRSPEAQQERILNIDEVTSIDKGGSPTDPANKQWLGDVPNQRTKSNFTEITTRVDPPKKYVSLEAAKQQGPEAFRKAAGHMAINTWDQTKEMKEIAEYAAKGVTGANNRAIANKVNRKINRWIKRGKQNPKAIRAQVELVREAFTEIGINYKTLAMPGTKKAPKGAGTIRSAPVGFTRSVAGGVARHGPGALSVVTAETEGEAGFAVALIAAHVVVPPVAWAVDAALLATLVFDADTGSGDPHPDFHWVKETDVSVEYGPGNPSMVPRSRHPGKTIRYH